MKRIGIIGAGQLGQMLGIAGLRMGLEFVFLDPSDDPPAAVAGPVLKYPFDSEEGLARLAAAADIITYEFENVPVAAIAHIAPGTAVFPPAQALKHAQDRLAEKTLFEYLGIPVPEFRTVESPDDLRRAAGEIGLPIVLKTRRLGYDGKGQFIVRKQAEIETACAGLGGKNLIAEAWVPFDREISAIGARNVSGAIVHYPLTENEHDSGILRVSRAPAEAEDLEETANGYLTALLERLDYVGVLALELFVKDDRLFANEFAPRVHNSGHWTIEGADTSQFENHLRAILDMPLGDTGMRGFAGMLNLIGKMPQDLAAMDEKPSHLHDYGKAARPGRKLGHATIVTATEAERETALEYVAGLAAD
jgi:5-(carboxyamino)imidazole ribonucleotide synthase